MTNELFESLLFEEEGTTIDFKKEQYRFVNASEDDKSELVNDILGFANAWRRAKAYILWVSKRFAATRVTWWEYRHRSSWTITRCNSSSTPLSTRQPIFNTAPSPYLGKQVGIFVLDEGQQRPIYLKRNYGKLDKEKVYVRRGSSTNPSKPASAGLGDTRARQGRPEIDVQPRVLTNGGRVESLRECAWLDLQLAPVAPPGRTTENWANPHHAAIRATFDTLAVGRALTTG
jgi:hypothetical protein